MSTEPSVPRGEDGAALIFTMLAALVLAGVATMFLANAVSELKATGQSRDHESAVHVAEVGAEEIVARLSDSLNYVTPGYTMDPSLDLEGQRSWALQAFADAKQLPTPPDSLFGTPGGTAFGVRPTNATTGRPYPFVFGVGEVGGTGQAEVRVVKLAIDGGVFTAQHALLTGPRDPLTGCTDTLDISGSAEVLGTAGNVHSNCNLTVGNSVEISGSATSSGTASPTPPAMGGQPVVEIPDIDARLLYPFRHDYPTSWYDLCPDNTVRRPSPAGRPPCEGTAITDHQGWTAPSSASGPWTLTGGNGKPGVYYVHHGSVQIDSNVGRHTGPVPMTVITSDSTGSCAAGQGEIRVTGTPALQSYLLGLQFISDCEMFVAGNVSLNGFIGTNDVLTLTGNMTLTGSAVAEHGVEVNESSTLGGNPTIRYDGGLTVPLSTNARITMWNEL